MQAHFQYWHHSDVNVPLKIKIDSLFLSWAGYAHDAVRTLDLSVQLFMDGLPFASPNPVGRFSFDSDGTVIDKFIVFPLSIRDLSLDSTLLFELVPTDAKNAIYATIPLFSKRTLLRQSRQLLIFQDAHQINYSPPQSSSNQLPPCRVSLADSTFTALQNAPADALDLSQALRKDKRLDLYSRQQVSPSYPSLDALAVEAASSFVHNTIQKYRSSAEKKYNFLCIYLPVLQHAVVFCHLASPGTNQQQQQLASQTTLQPLPVYQSLLPSNNSSFQRASQLFLNSHVLSGGIPIFSFIEKTLEDNMTSSFAKKNAANSTASNMIGGAGSGDEFFLKTRYSYSSLPTSLPPATSLSATSSSFPNLKSSHALKASAITLSTLPSLQQPQQQQYSQQQQQNQGECLFSTWHQALLLSSNSSAQNFINPSRNLPPSLPAQSGALPIRYLLEPSNSSANPSAHLTLRDTRLSRQRHLICPNISSPLASNSHADHSSLQPNNQQRATLDKLISLSPRSLSPSERSLVWTFRMSLTSEGAALPLFLLAVDFNIDSEREEAHALLSVWKAPTVSDALRLLSREFSDSVVREYAVQFISKASDDDVDVYLLQLVQALRFEFESQVQTQSQASSQQVTMQQQSGSQRVSSSPLCQMLMSRSMRSDTLASSFHWYLLSEALGDAPVANKYANILVDFDAMLRTTSMGREIRRRLHMQRLLRSKLLAVAAETFKVKGTDRKKNLMRDLMSQKEFKFANVLLSRQVPHEESEKILKPLFHQTGDLLPEEADESDNEAEETASIARVEQEEVEDLPSSAEGTVSFNSTIASALQKERCSIVLKLLEDEEGFSETSTPVPSPLNAQWGITKIIPASCSVFTSAMYPMLITCRVRKLKPIDVYIKEKKEFAARSKERRPVEKNPEEDETVSEPSPSPPSPYEPEGATTTNVIRFIFKDGDDLRQDQLVMQLFSWADRILRSRGLDLCLSPYKILACSQRDGLVEFVADSLPVAEVIRKHGDIISFFLNASQASKEAAAAGEKRVVPESVLSAYTRSCAGYGVLTYLLGVGDRHLDNLLLTSAGKVCHIDFGFIFGQDPKPWPPPMRLNRQMVDALEGVRSNRFALFRRLCSEAFRYIRREAKLLLSMIELMSESGIKDLGKRPELVLEKTANKFRLDLDENSAEFHLQTKVINESVGAVLPELYDYIHSMANFLKG
eukprot:GDKJ01005140.1.p1 GENE.GDKJ01005140.1~~GDKJ01005140.1.p1  ORF type:complete len:1199 (-),score=302.79 GDKJ01005140.1:49-3645(-)